jgi:hypothetical protein
LPTASARLSTGPTSRVTGSSWRRLAGLVDLVATPPQLVAHLVDGGAECGYVLAGGEQVDVLGRSLDHAVFADRAGPGEGEAVDAGEGNPGDLSLDGDLAGLLRPVLAHTGGS